MDLANVSRTPSLQTIMQDPLLFTDESENHLMESPFNILKENNANGSENVLENCSGSENYLMESPFNILKENNANGGENVPEYPNYILYQNLNVRSSADIIAIQSVDLKIVLQKYQNDKNSLENNDRVIIAKAIINHLLMTNLNRV